MSKNYSGLVEWRDCALDGTRATQKHKGPYRIFFSLSWCKQSLPLTFSDDHEFEPFDKACVGQTPYDPDDDGEYLES